DYSQDRSGPHELTHPPTIGPIPTALPDLAALGLHGVASTPFSDERGNRLGTSEKPLPQPGNGFRLHRKRRRPRARTPIGRSGARVPTTGARSRPPGSWVREVRGES